MVKKAPTRSRVKKERLKIGKVCYCLLVTLLIVFSRLDEWGPFGAFLRFMVVLF